MESRADRRLPHAPAPPRPLRRTSPGAPRSVGGSRLSRATAVDRDSSGIRLLHSPRQIPPSR
ncbi:hypothetical protein DQ240_17505 [Blastococcus sp. TF02A-26]|nr:hypothetical protein DQ240_17505 [Blastococcus sp. TF02A-26]